jgi:protein-tyrosine phosphatase
MFQILFVCTGNICRSPMAEGLLKGRMPLDLIDRVAISSAGTHAVVGRPAEDKAREVMAMKGFHIDQHRARQVTREMIKQADLLLVMEKGHLKEIRRLQGWGKSPARLIGEFGLPSGQQEIYDPYGEPLPRYEACYARLRPCVDGIIEWLNKTLAPGSGATLA